MLRIALGFAGALGALTLTAAPTRAQLVTNGDMTATVNVSVFNATVPPGWMHDPPTANTFDATSTMFSTAWQASANGGTFVHAGGITNPNVGTEGVSQMISGLVPGAVYELSFEQSATWGSIWSHDTHGYWAVTFGAQAQNSALVPIPAGPGLTTPWMPQTMTFTASAPSQLLRFVARDLVQDPLSWLTAQMGLDGVKLCQVGLCGGAPGQWLYTVGDDNVLRAVDLDAGCSVTTIGVTQDPPNGPVRKLRGLVWAAPLDILIGVTREGDVVRVDRFTGQTTPIIHLPFGNPATEFWGGLAYDGVDTLYTANAFDGHELVAIKIPAFTTTLVGSTVTSGGTPRQILGLDILPATAPPGAPHPAPGVLYGSDRSTQSVVTIDTNTAVVTDVGGNLGLGAPQAVAFHPFSGTLFGLDDQGFGNVDLTTYDFGALQGNPHCALPFEIVEQAATPDFGWGGMAFVRPGAWSNQGCALAGVSGDPLLVATGSMVPGSVNTVLLSNAAPNANSILFAALSSTPVMFFGGMLKPFPFQASLSVTTSGSGSVLLPFTIPLGWPSGTELWAQWAIQDVAAINNVSLSNAVLGVVP